MKGVKLQVGAGLNRATRVTVRRRNGETTARAVADDDERRPHADLRDARSRRWQEGRTHHQRFQLTS